MDPATIIGGLVQRGIPVHIAQGMVANMMAESRLDPGINEIAPLVPGSRGGFGLNQWTGPRRKQFEAFAKSQGVAADDLNAQLDFTMWELQNTERNAWNALQGARDPREAARIYSDKFLRPGIPHMDRRLAYADKFAGVQPGQNAFASQPQGGMDQMQQFNALASMMPRYEAPQLDANAFRIGRV
jgi:hypothetical protein